MPGLVEGLKTVMARLGCTRRDAGPQKVKKRKRRKDGAFIIIDIILLDDHRGAIHHTSSSSSRWRRRNPSYSVIVIALRGAQSITRFP
jgi:hypothetical protein